MCRHLAYLGRPASLQALLFDPPHSLCTQAYAPRMQQHGLVNVDGFGAGWYVRGRTEPVRYRRASSIWSDQSFGSLAPAVESGCVLAAVRSATPGFPCEESGAAPFTHGRWLFSHNGRLADYRLAYKALRESSAWVPDALAPVDSALLFGLAVAHWEAGASLGAGLAQVVRDVDGLGGGRLNLLATDGTDARGHHVGRHPVRPRAAVRPAAAGTGTCGRGGERGGGVRRAGVRTLRRGVRLAARPRPLPDRDDRARRDRDRPLEACPRRKRLGTPQVDSAASPYTGRQPEHRSKEEFRVTMPRIAPRISRYLTADDLAAGLAYDVRTGLSATPKALPPKYFYDARGSELFEEITRLEEYYPTRTEERILRAKADDIVGRSGADTLVELGSGSSTKTRLLLDGMRRVGRLGRYVPVDVSESALQGAMEALAADYPSLDMHGVVADFERHLQLLPRPGTRMVAFLGGTIGNLPPGQRARFLAAIRAGLAPGDRLLLGTDLVKSPERLIQAYDDRAGVTAEFNRNVLHVVNRELDADFVPDAFEHVARWDAEREWIEMRLRSTSAQIVRIAQLDLEVRFAAGEEMRTEISAKFRRERVEQELATAGLRLDAWWTDPASDFALSLSAPVKPGTPPS